MAIYLNANDYIYSSPNYAPISYSDRPISFSFWVRPDTLDRWIFSIGNAQYVEGYWGISINSSGRCNLQPTALTTTNSAVVGEWSHIAVAISVGSSRVWLDGDDANSISASTLSWNSVSYWLTLGMFIRITTIYTPGMVGSLSDFTYWKDYALTASDALALSKGADVRTIMANKIHIDYRTLGDVESASKCVDAMGNFNLENIVGSPTKVESKPRIRNYFMAGCG